MRRANGAYVNDQWTKQHHNIIKAAASDPRTARIFVFPGAKVQMCKDENEDRAWLNKVRPWWGHHEIWYMPVHVDNQMMRNKSRYANVAVSNMDMA